MSRKKRSEFVRSELTTEGSESSSPVKTEAQGCYPLRQYILIENPEPNKKTDGRKTTEFRYLLERKALRMMRRYYKEKFEGMFQYKNRMKEMTAGELTDMMAQFLGAELKPFPRGLLSPGQIVSLNESLKVVILCDRYNKGEAVVAQLDLSLIRNVLNRYNTENMNSFLSIMANSFLFVHFYLVSGRESSGA